MFGTQAGHCGGQKIGVLQLILDALATNRAAVRVKTNDLTRNGFEQTRWF